MCIFFPDSFCIVTSVSRNLLSGGGIDSLGGMILHSPAPVRGGGNNCVTPYCVPGVGNDGSHTVLCAKDTVNYFCISAVVRWDVQPLISNNTGLVIKLDSLIFVSTGGGVLMLSIMYCGRFSKSSEGSTIFGLWCNEGCTVRSHHFFTPPGTKSNGGQTPNLFVKTVKCQILIL